MPNGIRAFISLTNAGIPHNKALAVASALAMSRDPSGDYHAEAVTDCLCGGGFEEELAQEIADTLACCFPSERFKRSFIAAQRKFALVRAGLAAASADSLLAAIDGCIVVGRDREIRAPIPHVPNQGRVVMCDFRFLRRPEMQKERRAIVVSKRFAGTAGRCLVVPVSKAISNAGHPLHHEFPAGSYPCFHPTEPVWAVCDHVYTVSITRLWQVNINRRPVIAALLPADLTAVKALVGTAIGV